MFGTLIALALGAKAPVASAAIVLIGGVIVTASAGAGATTVPVTPRPAVAAVLPAPDVLVADVLVAGDPAGEPVPNESEQRPVLDPGCEEGARAATDQARSEARERVRTAFARLRADLDALRAQLGARGSAEVREAVAGAGALLEEIASEAERALDDIGSCAPVAPLEAAAPPAGSDVAGVATVQSVAFTFRGAAAVAAFVEIADRGVSAMGTVFNIAKQTILAELERLRPKPTAKPTQKSISKEEKRRAKEERKAEEKRRWEEKRQAKEERKAEEKAERLKERVHRAKEKVRESRKDGKRGGHGGSDSESDD